MKTKNTVQYRQGDVLLVRVNQMPADVKPAVVTGEGGAGARHILAYGEATGHHHSVTADPEQVEGFIDGLGVTWLEVKQAVELLHQEHDPITVEPGKYKVIRQREYVLGSETRQVRD